MKLRAGSPGLFGRRNQLQNVLRNRVEPALRNRVVGEWSSCKRVLHRCRENAAALIGGEYLSHGRVARRRLSQAFIVREEQQLVANDRTSNRPAELVPL